MSHTALMEVSTAEGNGIAPSHSNGGTATLEQVFIRLAEQWRRETLAMSSLTDIVLHPAYYQIIGMGTVALPWVLRELQQGGGQRRVGAVKFFHDVYNFGCLTTHCSAHMSEIVQ